MCNEHDRIENNFTYHPPKGDQPERYERIRTAATDFVLQLLSFCPLSRELAKAQEKVEEAVMWANASIARNE